MTRIGLGCARLGSASGGGWRESVRLVHVALDHGVSFFDTADAYGAGASEHVLGRALRGRRSCAVIASKGGYLFTERSALQRRIRAAGAKLVTRVLAGPPGARVTAGSSGYTRQDFSPEYLTSALEGSLRRLATDHIDIYQLHGPRNANPDIVAEWGARTVASGKIGRLGVGAEDIEQATRWLACPEVSSVQVPFGVLDAEAGVDVIPAAHASGRIVVARGVLGAGLLTDPTNAVGANAHKLPVIQALRSVAAQAGQTVAELAVGYVRVRDDVDVILVGTRSPDHLGEIVATLDAPLPDAALLASVQETLAAYHGTQSDH